MTDNLVAAYSARPAPTPAQSLDQQNAEIAVNDREIAALEAQVEAAKKAQAAPPRTAVQRFTDSLVDAFQRNPTVSAFRAQLLQSSSSILGALSTSPGDLLAKAGVASMTTDQRATFDAQNQSALHAEAVRRANLQAVQQHDPFYRAPGGVVGKAVAGAATLAGTLVGGAADPINLLNPVEGSVGKTLASSGVRAAAKVAAKRAVGQGAVMAAGNLVSQTNDVGDGLQDHYDPVETLAAAAVGAGLSTVHDAGSTVFHLLRSPVAVEPALTEPEIADTVVPTDASSDDAVSGAQEAPQAAEGGLPATNPTEGVQGPPAAVPGPSGEIDASGPPPGEPRSSAELVPAAANDDVPATMSEPQAFAGGSSQADGATAGEPQGDPWAHVDWGKVGSPERVKAAMAHLDDLRAAIKPEHVQDFLDYVGRQETAGILGEGRAGPINPRYVDWDALRSDPDRLVAFTRATQDIFSDLYAKAGDSTRSWATTEAAAKTFGTSVLDLVKTHADVVGEGGLSARIGALADMALSMADDYAGKLSGFKEALAKGDFSGINDFAAATQSLVLMESMAEGSVSEVARMLNYLKRLKGAKTDAAILSDPLRDFADAFNNGREMSPDDLKAAVDNLDRAFRKRGAQGIVDETTKMRKLGFQDWLQFYITAGLLSAPKTAIKNFVGSPLMLAFQVAERYVGAGIGAARAAAGRGSAERMTFAEANAYVTGAIAAFHDSLRAGLEGLRTGQSLHGDALLGDSLAGFGNLSHSNIPRWDQTSREAWRAQWAESGFSLDLAAKIGFSTLNEVLMTPGLRPHAAFDAAHKVTARNAQLAGLAVREAAFRASQAAPEIADRVREDTLQALLQRPTAAAFDKARAYFRDRGLNPETVYPADAEAEQMALLLKSVDIQKIAARHALVATFQNSGPKLRQLDLGLRSIPLLKALYVPFLRVPFNLLKAGVVDRNPFLNWTNADAKAGFANLSRAAEDDLRAVERGGAEGDLALARYVTGAGIMTLAGLLFMSGNLVGRRGQPGSPQAYDGIPEYSVRLPGGSWVQYDQFDPIIGTHLGLVADMAQTLRDKDLSEDHASALVGGVFAAIRNNVLNKSTLTGLRQLFETIYGSGGGQGGSDKAGAKAAAEGLSETAMSLFPLSSLSRSVVQSMDPVKRDARGLIDHIAAITPGWSETLPARRDAFGRPLVLQPGERGPLAAFKVAEPTTDPLDNEQARLGSVLPDFTIRPEPRRFNGQEVTPAEYSRFLEVQGQLYRDRHTGLNMEEAALTLIAGDRYAAASDQRRSQLLKDLVTGYREHANAEIRDPRSPFFMGVMVARTGGAQLQREVQSKGLQGGRLRHRAHELGVPAADAGKLQAMLSR